MLLQPSGAGPRTLGQAAACLGVADRTLHEAFAAVRGTSPGRHLKRRRLELVRDALLAEPDRRSAVKWFAMAHGFRHLGNFAHAYHDALRRTAIGDRRTRKAGVFSDSSRKRAPRYRPGPNLVPTQEPSDPAPDPSHATRCSPQATTPAGWIQVVVATPRRRGLRWALGDGGRIGRCELCWRGHRPAGVARREDRRRFWAAIAAGRSSEEAAIGVGVSPAVGARWFREAGGMPPSTLGRSSKPPSGRYLSFAEREEIALWRAQGRGVREIARRLGRAASTISRGAAAQCRDAQRRPGVSGQHRAVARRARRRGVRSRRSWRSTRRCGATCRTGWPARSPPRAGLRYAGRPCPGRAGGMGVGRPGDGQGRGARSRSLSACDATFPTMRRCASATRRSTRRCTCRAEARCGAS